MQNTMHYRIISWSISFLFIFLALWQASTLFHASYTATCRFVLHGGLPGTHVVLVLLLGTVAGIYLLSRSLTWYTSIFLASVLMFHNFFLSQSLVKKLQTRHLSMEDIVCIHIPTFPNRYCIALLSNKRSSSRRYICLFSTDPHLKSLMLLVIGV